MYKSTLNVKLARFTTSVLFCQHTRDFEVRSKSSNLVQWAENSPVPTEVMKYANYLPWTAPHVNNGI